jgi:tetratricopeptide (TPR) repeat protein
VAAGQIIDEDADLAMAHAVAARRLASRIAVVREAVGLAAYAAGDWATAIAELRTYHRMTGRQTHLAELADCERALGRPERAIDLFRGADRDSLDKAGAIELLIVAAGARGDLGQHDAAVAMLQVRELTSNEDAEWAARLRYAYADSLLSAGRRDEAREWFGRAAAVDEDSLTDAEERLLELDGVTIEGDDDDDDDDEEATAQAGDGDSAVESDELEATDGESAAEPDEFEDDDAAWEELDDDPDAKPVVAAVAVDDEAPVAAGEFDDERDEDRADDDEAGDLEDIGDALVDEPAVDEPVEVASGAPQGDRVEEVATAVEATAVKAEEAEAEADEKGDVGDEFVAGAAPVGVEDEKAGDGRPNA